MHFPRCKCSNRSKGAEIRAVKGVEIVGAHLDSAVAAQQLMVEVDNHLTSNRLQYWRKEIRRRVHLGDAEVSSYDECSNLENLVINRRLKSI